MKCWELKCSSERRIEIFDFMRGALMILVILHHSGIWYGQYILAFHMPMFFILSGCLFRISYSGESIKFGDYFRKKFIKLIIPYFLFEVAVLLISLVICCFSNTHIFLGKAILSIITVINMEGYTGVMMRLWFLPCMFVCDIYFWYLYRIIKKNIKYNYLIMIGLIIISYILSYASIERLPFTIDIAVMGTAFILFGFSIFDKIKHIFFEPIKIKSIVIAVLCIIFMVICVSQNSSNLLMYNDIYGNYLYAIAGAIVGSIAFLVIFKCCYDICKKINCLIIFRYVTWLGQNSLVVFPLHLLLLYFVRKILDLIGLNVWPFSATMTLICLVPIINVFTLLKGSMTKCFKKCEKEIL